MPTHLIGATLLRGEWKTAVSMILDPREGDILLLFVYALKRFFSNLNPSSERFFALCSDALSKWTCVFLTQNFVIQKDSIRKVREYYKESNDIDGTLKQLPRYLVAERAIVSSLLQTYIFSCLSCSF